MGGPETYPQYATGWTLVGKTPFPRWKRIVHAGGINDPMIFHYLKGTTDNGSVRTQYVHTIDITPTVLDLIGLEFPDHIEGVPQEEVAGRSFKRSLESAGAPETRHTQYYEMYGNRTHLQQGMVRLLLPSHRGDAQRRGGGLPRPRSGLSLGAV
jgi:arylsulfatase A-like enzyme